MVVLISANYIVLSHLLKKKDDVIKFSEIMLIQKVDIQSVAASIRIDTIYHSSMLSIPFYRNEAYVVLMELWMRTRRMLQREFVSFGVIYYRSTYLKMEHDNDRYTPNKKIDLASILKETTFEDLSIDKMKDKKNTEDYCALFNLPSMYLLIC